MTVFHRPKRVSAAAHPHHDPFGAVESTCKRIGRDLLAFSQVHLSRDDIVQAFIPKTHHAAYAKLVDFIRPEPARYGTFFEFTVEGALGAAQYAAEVPYIPLMTTIVPSCPKAVREKLEAFSDERVRAYLDAGNILEVFAALNVMLNSFHQFKFLFAGFEAVMRETSDTFAVQLKLVEDYKRPSSLPKIAPELATAIKSAQATIAKWTLLKDVERPRKPDNALVVRVASLSARRLSWDSSVISLASSWTL